MKRVLDNRKVFSAAVLVMMLLLPVQLMAWYPNQYYQPYSRPYPHPYMKMPHSNFYTGPGWQHYRYRKPQWMVRGRINRFGGYYFEVKLRGVSQYDLYRAWLLYQRYGNR